MKTIKAGKSQTPIFLRDLSDDYQKELKRAWRNKHNSKLLKAVDEEEDIVIGVFVNPGKEFVW